jgi:LPS O-antigen subunit length determinant protein (WzzB/FepE family)
MEIEHRIGSNINLKLRLEKEKIKEELDQVKIQRDIALRKLNKALQIAKDLRKLIENGHQTK